MDAVEIETQDTMLSDQDFKRWARYAKLLRLVALDLSGKRNLTTSDQLNLDQALRGYK